MVPTYAMHIIEEALLSVVPKPTYQLIAPGGFSNYVTAITERFAHQGQYKNKEIGGVAYWRNFLSHLIIWLPKYCLQKCLVYTVLVIY